MPAASVSFCFFSDKFCVFDRPCLMTELCNEIFRLTADTCESGAEGGMAASALFC